MKINVMTLLAFFAKTMEENLVLTENLAMTVVKEENTEIVKFMNRADADQNVLATFDCMTRKLHTDGIFEDEIKKIIKRLNELLDHIEYGK